jgi:hypothetical protein
MFIVWTKKEMSNGQKILLKYIFNNIFYFAFQQVKAITVRMSNLIARLKSDQKIHEKLNEPIVMCFFSASGSVDQTTTGLDGHFVQSLLLIDVLLHMKSVESDKKELTSLCKQTYTHKADALDKIREFEMKSCLIFMVKYFF